MERLKFIFSFNGRINRLQFIAYIFTVYLGLYSVSFILSFVHQLVFLVAAVPFFITWLWISVSLSVQRAHDFGSSGIWAAIFFLPLLNLFLFLAPGSSGANQYGEPPGPNTSLVKILGSIAVLCAFGPLIFALLSVVPVSDEKWVYESYCNYDAHKNIHKQFVGKEEGFKECNDFMNNHFDDYKCQKNECGEYHSAGCRMVEAPFPWSLSL